MQREGAACAGAWTERAGLHMQHAEREAGGDGTTAPVRRSQWPEQPKELIGTETPEETGDYANN